MQGRLYKMMLCMRTTVLPLSLSLSLTPLPSGGVESSCRVATASPRKKLQQLSLPRLENDQQTQQGFL